jgi:transcriptional accessory protein Tex/SPT6
MEFWQHLKANNELDLQGITEGLACRLAELMARGHSVADLLAHYGDDFGHLPPERLRALALAHRTWQIWRRRKTQHEEARRKAKLAPLPTEVFALAPKPDQLDAIVRTSRLAARGDPSASASPEAAPAARPDAESLAILGAGVELWTRCLATARKQGKVVSRAKNLEHPGASSYDAYVRLDEGLQDLAPHRWLAMRRGEREGVLELTLEVPREQLLEEVTRVQGRLGSGAAQRTPESLLQELILDDLHPWLLRVLDNEAQTQAIKSAAEAFAGLLRAPALQTRLLGVVYLTKAHAPVAAVVIDREGEIAAQRVVKAEGAWLDRVGELIQEHNLQHVVIPTSALAPELLATLETKISELGAQAVKVRTAAVAEARQPLVDPPSRLSPSVASAVVLARRALDPLKEWSLVDPVAIGIAEYQNDLETEQLRAALLETAELCRLERRRGKRLYMSGGAAPRGSAAMARLNPLVKTLADLRGGMTVHGVVTNISHFGAFVNLGLPQEALVHISELSDRFVSNPNEVVSIGQQVTAHVLAVDPGRGRISLSLKTQRPGQAQDREERRPPRGESMPRGGPGGGVRPGATMSKAEALANLEKLFKK